MTDASRQPTQAAFIEAPRDHDLQALFQYWQGKRGTRAMPSRADLDPAEFRGQLPHVMLYNVGGPGAPYTIRLVGTAIVRFIGRDFTGKPAITGMDQAGAMAMVRLLDTVVAERAPKFRLGKAFWWREKSYRSYEAALMPLSADGAAVNMIFAGVKFDTAGTGGAA